MVKAVVSISGREELDEALISGADMIEIRLDLMQDDAHEIMQELCGSKKKPLIVTIRSQEEGGEFTGGPAEWFALIEPWISCADYIDIEQRYSAYAGGIKGQGTGIIASVHMHSMPSDATLRKLDKQLRAYGDIPKIVVTPESRDDLIRLITFTNTAVKPVITGVMGEKFRYARALLPLFGSEVVYCYTGSPTAGGQYHISEMKKILEMLR